VCLATTGVETGNDMVSEVVSGSAPTLGVVLECYNTNKTLGNRSWRRENG
jgi:hypothetical protein